jgi:excinuclease ABC subunit C
VSWEGEAFNKTKYRHYHLKSNDEYAQMKELLSERALRFEKDGVPDLWVIDGGQTLLNLAHDILESVGVSIDVIAIAKEKIDAKAHRAKGGAKDKLYTQKEEYLLPTTDKRLQFFQRLRDEAHRFAISFHRKTKRKEDKNHSKLKQQGLSDARIKKLLQFYGTFETIYQASYEEISTLIGKKEAKKLFDDA